MLLSKNVNEGRFYNELLDERYVEDDRCQDQVRRGGSIGTCKSGHYQQEPVKDRPQYTYEHALLISSVLTRDLLTALDR